MKKLSIKPLNGTIILCDSKEEYQAQYKRRFGKEIDLTVSLGRTDGDGNKGQYLVWASGKPQLSHEFAHVLFFVFDLCGINPSDSQGEMFCYHLSQLLIDAGDYAEGKT
jgi:hypothetical protein